MDSNFVVYLDDQLKLIASSGKLIPKTNYVKDDRQLPWKIKRREAQK
jgi:hypothetical protein